jgi:hypothetical protein
MKIIVDNQPNVNKVHLLRPNAELLRFFEDELKESPVKVVFDNNEIRITGLSDDELFDLGRTFQRQLRL